jgi:diphthamide biosynthesis methyltransferase
MWNKLDEHLNQFEKESDTILIAVQEAMFKALLNENMGDLPVVLCSDMGTQDQEIVFTTVGGLEHLEGGRLNCLLVPAWTSEVEEKALLRWKQE